MIDDYPTLVHLYQINDNAALKTHEVFNGYYSYSILLSILTSTLFKHVNKTACIGVTSSTLGLVLRRLIYDIMNSNVALINY